MGPLDLRLVQIVAGPAELAGGTGQQVSFIRGMRVVASEAIPLLEWDVGNLYSFLFQRFVAAKAQLAAYLRELELLWSGVGIVAGSAVSIPHRAVDRGLAKRRLLFFVAAITQLATFLADQLWVLGRMRAVTTRTLPLLHRGVHMALCELFLQLAVAFET